MNIKTVIVSVCLLLLLSCSNKSGKKKEITQDGSVKFRVAAYNVRVGRDATAKEIGEKLKPYNFDVVCFSEAPGGDWTKEVGNIMGLNHLVVGKYTTAGHKDKYKTIVSKTPLFDYEEILMADTLHSVTKATTTLGSKKIGIYSVHFPSGWRDQAHIDETTGKITAFINYLKEVPEDEIPVIMGDFNFYPSNPDYVSPYYEMFLDNGYELCWKDLGIVYTKRNTHYRLRPENEKNGKVIDHIMFKTNQVRAVEGEIIEMEKPLSDHKPVWATLQFK